MGGHFVTTWEEPKRKAVPFLDRMWVSRGEELLVSLAPGRTGVMDWFGKMYLDEGEKIYI